MIALSILVKASLVVAAAAGLQRTVASRASAASRHLLWTLAIAGVLLLPVFVLLLPEWTAVTWTSLDALVPAPAAASAAIDPLPRQPAIFSPAAEPQANAATFSRTVSIGWSGILFGIYAAGLALLAGRMVAERVAMRRLARRALPVTDPAWTGVADDCAAALGIRRRVRLLRSHEQTMPMTFGIWQSSVLLPRDADEWSGDRRRAVLLHELAHVARFDCLTQTIAACATALYWPHPGIWWMARRLRVERELACDDSVLASGADAGDYAGHLLELAYALGNARTPALAVAMAGSRQLEGRMLAVLDAARHRAVPARRNRLAALCIMLAIVVPIAVVTAKAVPSRGDVAGAGPTLLDAGDVESQTRVEDDGPGTWELRAATEAGMVYLAFSHGSGRHGQTMPASELSGLTMAQLAGAGPVRFSLMRDAGTFDFEGVTRNGVAAGTYGFAPDASFPDELSKRGLGRPTTAQQQVLARQDIDLQFVEQITGSRGVPPTIERLVRAAEHGVDADFVDGLDALGYRSLDLEQLIALRDQGVDPDYIRELAEAGHRNLSLEQLVTLRNHGVDQDYISELAALGHRSLTLDRLVELRNHGVDGDYIRELAEAGHANVSLEELVRLRNQGVDADYIRELADLGHASLSRDELIALRNHGVDPDYIRELAALGYKGLSRETLVNLRNHGVDDDYIRDLGSVGYQGLSLQQLVELRNHGVDADYVRELAAVSEQKLSLQELIDLRRRGIDGDNIRKLRSSGLLK